MENSLVTFVIPTYNRYKEIKVILSSLQAQTNPNWKAIVVVDNTLSDTMINNYKLLHVLYEDKEIKSDKRININFLEKRCNDWGHTPREVGKQISDSQYVIMTGDDNYYIPTFVEELDKVSKDSPGIIYWDMVHSHYDYQYFKCHPSFNQIDMGAFATRTDLAKQIKLNTSYAADGEYVEDFKKKFPQENMVKIDKVLFVHN